MENADEEDDLKLIKASAGILQDLENELPRLLFKPGSGRVHTRVKKRDLDRVVNLIEPFQGEPQLLDAKLKSILPPIVNAYLEFLSLPGDHKKAEHVDLQTAVCTLLYTLCKVRGQKVVVGFLNNEPKYLEPVLEALEGIDADVDQASWQVPYVLLLWLSHLLLTPFDLITISNKVGPTGLHGEDAIQAMKLPHLVARVLRVGLAYLESPTKAQDAAAAMLVRLSIRPDVQRYRLADTLVNERLPRLTRDAGELSNMYGTLGSLRLVAGVASSAELSHLVPSIYRTCEKAFDENDISALSSNAVAKKIIVKIFRNVAILALRSVSSEGPLLSFLQTTDLLESVIDYLLRSLGDKDTPVRYAAAKAMSLIILELDSEMGHEVVQAILDSFKEDMPRYAKTIDFATANPLKWHGLTLALAHTLFKRSASPDQLPDILDALLSALQFQQRTATGTTLGTNVRDAANFGIWSTARRYTTAELLLVRASNLHASNQIGSHTSIIRVLAVQLVLSACLDPAGNIRRGSSAALQELVGRHPDQVYEGIALVQIVDYQAVSLRNRAMIDVAHRAAALEPSYWQALSDGLFEWRGLGSADVPSRQGAATSIAGLAKSLPMSERPKLLSKVTNAIQACHRQEVETLHGLTLTAANVIRDATQQGLVLPKPFRESLPALLATVTQLEGALTEFSPRLLRSEFPASLAHFTTAICGTFLAATKTSDQRLDPSQIPFDAIDTITDKLLWRREDWILQVIPVLVEALLKVKRGVGQPLGCIGAQVLVKKVSADGSKSTLHGVARAIALGTLAPLYDSSGLNGSKATMPIDTLCDLMTVMNVDWRIIGARALQIAVESVADDSIDASITDSVCAALHVGLNDYTVDERGDIGSLVRSQALSCTAKILGTPAFAHQELSVQVLIGDVYRLSLEKLDRVRLQAAQVRQKYLDLEAEDQIRDVATVSSLEYFKAALLPLTSNSNPEWTQRALLEGCTSCAGVSAEPLLQASRLALASYWDDMDHIRLEQQLHLYTTIMKDLLAQTPNTQPGLELLAFLLDMQIPQRLAGSNTFKWRNLLSIVQKSHHKSNDIPKMLAAVHVYTGLADIPAIRGEVLKKLISMLRTNPYPRVRLAVAEALWMVTGDGVLKSIDWTRSIGDNKGTVESLTQKLVTS